MKAVLALEDGKVFTGQSFGAAAGQWGEVVFNTGMTGYQEVLTDPSYAGQIVVMTYPLIGNYGVNRQDYESRRSFARGFVVREVCDYPSNWRAAYTMGDFLAREGVPGISGVDTRAITKHLRSYGAMRGYIATGEVDTEELVEKARTSPHLSGQNLVGEVATSEAYTLAGDGPRVVVVDLGVKQNIIRKLREKDCAVIVVPPTATAGEITALSPDGVLLSNGPGDPVDVSAAVGTASELTGKIPLFGICLGHQVLCLALGGKTYKMKFGHRGANHPVKDMRTGRVYITSHNHGYSVDEESLAGLDVEVSHVNLNDNTVEGIRHKKLPVFGVQYHPEASPGPHDSDYIFEQFMDMMRGEGQ
ncbi:MAG: glutamine-hydrolyzing carbamoyl-phosphate synthase small subunit [Firmicutes bacterium]|nr:glutamine-hydrolyzing carbamoyl-phosphate synthase small subunit [Bacillota bacterium]